MDVKVFHMNEIIYDELDKSNKVFFIRSGEIELSKVCKVSEIDLLLKETSFLNGGEIGNSLKFDNMNIIWEDKKKA
jgi:hypothetical protein